MVQKERKLKKPSKTATSSVRLSIKVTSLGELLPLKFSLRNSKPPVLFLNPMTVCFLPYKRKLRVMFKQPVDLGLGLNSFKTKEFINTCKFIYLKKQGY